LQKARQRLQEAEEKVERTRRWLRLLPDALAEVETPSRHLAGLLESDLRQALALLDGKIAALTAYAELAAREAGKGGP
jgi:truncated hemoglobin YjbI